jgi:hypothetical protein
MAHVQSAHFAMVPSGYSLDERAIRRWLLSGLGRGRRVLPWLVRSGGGKR